MCLALVLAMGIVGVGYAAWTDTIYIEGTVTTGSWDVGGTHGFWKNWQSHKTYTRSEIEGWLSNIDGSSSWLGPTTVEGMVALIEAGEAEGHTKYDAFLMQYLPTRLNAASGRLILTTIRDYYPPYDPGDYLGLGGQGTLLEIITKIESKYPDLPDQDPTDDEFEIMKDICDALNNLAI